MKDGTYQYKWTTVKQEKLSPDHTPGYSIILPGVFLHRAYLEMLFDSLIIAKELIEYIDEIMNCDDILTSVMVTKFMNDCGWPQSGCLQLMHQSIITNLESKSKCEIYTGPLATISLLNGPT